MANTKRASERDTDEAAAIHPGPDAAEATAGTQTPENPFAEPLEGKDATIVRIAHPDGTVLNVPHKNFVEFYQPDGYTITDEKPFTIEDMQAAGQTLDDRE